MLCRVCEVVFGKVLDSVEERYAHHSSHAGLTSSTTDGCFICSQIFEYITARGFQSNPNSHIPLITWTVDRISGNTWPTNINVWLRYRDISIHSQYGPERSRYAKGFGFRRVVPHDPSNGKETRLIPTAFWDSTGSTETTSQIADWLERCTKDHDLCNLRRETAWMPSRLLEVIDASGNLEVHLRDRSHLQYGRYLTLSHCWGPTGTQNLKLTSNSLKSFQDGIAASNLRPTFRDMVNMAWRLGIRLIWIDCMCIIQDDDQDWKRESALMGKVYANSWLNISANAAGNDCSGLFASRNGSHIVDYFHTRHDKNCETTTWEVTSSDIWADEVEGAPVNRRAWVLQERILSPRIVHMSKAMVLWECRKLQASEVFPDGGLPEERSLNNYGLLKQLYCESRSTDDRNIQADWRILLFRYTMCGLTFETDRLIALSGIASEVHKRTQCDYMAGLWSTQLPMSLLWNVLDPISTRSELYVAPSWSWASVRGHIWSPHLEGDYRIHAKILRYETSLANLADKYGQVTSGKIELRGPLGTLDWSGVHGKNTYKVGHVNISVPDESGRIGEIGELSSFRGPNNTLHFDCEGYAELRTAYIVVLLDQLEMPGPDGNIKPDSYNLQGLLLNRLPCSRYMRIGIARLEIKTRQELEDIVSKMPQQDITII